MSTTIDYDAVKEKQQSAWASGDYAVIGTTLQIVGELLAEACDVRFDEDVLDVAAGNGNATLAAARRGGNVMSTDYVMDLLDRGAERAAAEGLSVNFALADAEALPFGDATFDVVLSTFGVMFAPNHDAAASELARVCRPGGRIGLANWTPESLVGQMFGVLGRFLPPPAGVRPPSLWGDVAHLETLFGDSVASLDVTRCAFSFRYRSAKHMVDVFRAWYGPVHKAFAALPEGDAAALERDLIELFERNNTAEGTLVIPSEYLQVVAART
jgi:SAM-dependent methyltransferase